MAKSPLMCSITSLTHAENSIVNNKTPVHSDSSESALFSVPGGDGKLSLRPSSSTSFVTHNRSDNHAQHDTAAATTALPMYLDQFSSAPTPLNNDPIVRKSAGESINNFREKIHSKVENVKRSSSSRRRRRKFDKSIVRRNLTDTLLQKIMATHYPDKIYALFITSKNRKHATTTVPTSATGDDAMNIDEQLELYVEWGALRYAPVHKSTAKKKVKTLKTILPYTLMKKRYPEVVIRFFEEHLRFLDMTTSTSPLLFAADDDHPHAINSETKLVDAENSAPNDAAGRTAELA